MAAKTIERRLVELVGRDCRVHFHSTERAICIVGGILSANMNARGDIHYFTITTLAGKVEFFPEAISRVRGNIIHVGSKIDIIDTLCLIRVMVARNDEKDAIIRAIDKAQLTAASGEMVLEDDSDQPEPLQEPPRNT